MMQDKLLASDFLEKDILNLEDGDLIGTATGILTLDDPLRVNALAFYSADNGGHMAFCDYTTITDVDQRVIVVSSYSACSPSEDKRILGLSCLDCSGIVVGKVIDCEWQASDGHIISLIVSAMETCFKIPLTNVKKIGNSAVILNVTMDHLTEFAYQKFEHQGDGKVEDTSELIQTLIKRVGTTLAFAGQTVGERVKQIDKEEINREISNFTEKVKTELHNVIDTVAEQKKPSKSASMESEVASVMRDLTGFTVANPIFDHNGAVIIAPNQVITEDIVKIIIENDKIAELYRVAVSIQSEENHE